MLHVYTSLTTINFFFLPASAQSIGGLSSLKTSEVTLDMMKRLAGFTILTELSRGPSAILPDALIEGLRPLALRESLFVGFSSVDIVFLLMRSIGLRIFQCWNRRKASAALLGAGLGGYVENLLCMHPHPASNKNVFSVWYGTVPVQQKTGGYLPVPSFHVFYVLLILAAALG